MPGGRLASATAVELGLAEGECDGGGDDMAAAFPPAFLQPTKASNSAAHNESDLIEYLFNVG